MIGENLSLIGQKGKIISPKIRLHWDMERTKRTSNQQESKTCNKPK